MIATHANLELYFAERLASASTRLGTKLHIGAQSYLSGLLSAQAGHANTTLDETMVERWMRAMELEDRRKRAGVLRQSGDAALYTCGFFAESLERRGIAPSYVCQMGKRSYAAALELERNHDILMELAQNFDDYVNLLDEVREDTELRTPQAIIKLYDRWRKTGSPKLAERLRAEGLFPISDSRSGLLQ